MVQTSRSFSSFQGRLVCVKTPGQRRGTAWEIDESGRHENLEIMTAFNIEASSRSMYLLDFFHNIPLDRKITYLALYWLILLLSFLYAGVRIRSNMARIMFFAVNLFFTLLFFMRSETSAISTFAPDVTTSSFRALFTVPAAADEGMIPGLHFPILLAKRNRRYFNS